MGGINIHFILTFLPFPFRATCEENFRGWSSRSSEGIQSARFKWIKRQRERHTECGKKIESKMERD